MRQFINILLFTFLIIGCSWSNQEKAPISTSDYQEMKAKNEYSIRVPSYMLRIEESNPIISLQCIHATRKIHFMVLDEKKDVIKQFFYAIGDYSDSISLLEKYAQIQVDQIYSNYEVISELRPNPIRHKDFDSYSFEVDVKGPFKNLEVSYYLSVLEADDSFYSIVGFTDKKKVDRFRETFKNVVQSFKLL